MNQWEKADAAKKAKEEGYKQSAYDENKFIKDGKTVTINENTVNVNGSSYNNSHDAKNSKKW